MTPAEILALALFAGTLIAVMTRPLQIPEGAAAAIGACAMLATGLVSLGDLGAVLRDNLTVFAFFLGMMALTTLAEGAHVFDLLAEAAARLARGSRRRLFLNVFILGTLISTFLTNDATALILTPVVYALVTRLRLDPLPYVFACTFIADTASTVLPVSNPINVILGQRFPGLLLGDFLHYLLLPSVAAIAINIVAFTIIFRRSLRGGFDPQATATRLQGDDLHAFRIASGVLVAVAVAFVVASQMRPAPVGAVALAGAAALLIATGLQGRLRWRALAGGVSWGIFPFIAGMFLLVRGVEHQGVTHQLGLLLGRLAGTGTMRPAIVSTLFAAAASNLLNNVPAVAVMNATIPTIHAANSHAVVYGTLIGCDLGPNLTVVGSLATMLWLLLLRQRNMEVSALQYARLGVIVTPAMLLVSGALMGLLVQ